MGMALPYEVVKVIEEAVQDPEKAAKVIRAISPISQDHFLYHRELIQDPFPFFNLKGGSLKRPAVFRPCLP